MDLDSAANQLYGLLPDEFVAARTALVKQARADGNRELATAVQQLARPTRSAWLVNLLARRRPDVIEQLLDLAELLAEGMRTVSGPELQQLTRQRNALIASLTRTALGFGQESGQRANESIRREIADTLTAALADSDVAEQVRSGRVARAVQWSGFGLSTGTASPRTLPGRTTPTLGGSTPGDDEDGPDSVVAPVVELDARRRTAALARVRSALDRSRQERRRASEAVTRADHRVTEAEVETREADAAAETARQEARKTEAALRAAERSLQRAQQDHDRASQDADHTRTTREAATTRLRLGRDEHTSAATRLSTAEAEVTALEVELTALGDGAIGEGG